VDIDDNTTCLERAPLLALGSAAQEGDEVEPLPSLRKLITETGLSEIKTILGWLLDFRWMIIALPDNKFHAYSKAILEMLQRGWTSKGELESNIGRWVHLGQIIPIVHHFLSRLCFLKQRSENRQQIKINKQCTLKIPSFLICVPVRIHAYQYASKPDGSQTALKLPLILANTTKSSMRVNILS
jgi:hypothetical protein